MKKLMGFVSAAGLMFIVACSQTDAGITTKVKSQLAADDTVKAYQVDVDTENHVVTLKGEVQSSAARDRAVELARSTTGVADVIDRLTVTDTAATSGRLDSDDVDLNIDSDVKADAKRTGEAARSGAEKAADATVQGAKKVGKEAEKGAKKVGSAIKDAVTDDEKK